MPEENGGREARDNAFKIANDLNKLKAIRDWMTRRNNVDQVLSYKDALDKYEYMMTKGTTAGWQTPTQQAPAQQPVAQQATNFDKYINFQGNIFHSQYF